MLSIFFFAVYRVCRSFTLSQSRKNWNTWDDPPSFYPSKVHRSKCLILNSSLVMIHCESEFGVLDTRLNFEEGLAWGIKSKFSNELSTPGDYCEWQAPTLCITALLSGDWQGHSCDAPYKASIHRQGCHWEFWSLWKCFTSGSTTNLHNPRNVTVHWHGPNVWTLTSGLN